jgi:hypothetical protein
MYSPPLVSGTAHAIGLALGTRAEEDGEDLQSTVRILCADARRLGMRPEELVVLVKLTWRTHPETHALPRSQADAVLKQIVSMCIDEYFRSGVVG